MLMDDPNKKNLWLALNAVNALEGIRFYVSFACSWAFAELKKMEGNAKIIKFIARDENTHLASTTTMLKLLRQEPGYEKIAKEIANGKIVGWFQDKSESGNRALGNRSILADPRRKDIKDVINKTIKMREDFRPFAPAVLEEHYQEYFDT